MSNNVSVTSYGNYESYANEKDMLEALHTGDKSKMITQDNTNKGPHVMSHETQKRIANHLIQFRQHQTAELLGISVEELKELEKNMWKHNVK